MTLAIRDRPLSSSELEQMRLLLSTFRDGSGQSVAAGFMPDYLSFERVTAIVCHGQTTENKGIFDVTVPGGAGRKNFGVSCKMAVAQPSLRLSWFMELSNSAKKFHDAFSAAGINWQIDPPIAGPIMVELVESWHHAAADHVDIGGSKYLLLTHDARWVNFELASFDLNLQRRDARTEVEWVTEGRNGVISSLAGYIHDGDRTHRLWQFFGNSGGQLKYYPLIGWEEWRSGTFQLEEPPVHDLKAKARGYWPDLWSED